jgi:hypothetical protein
VGSGFAASSGAGNHLWHWWSLDNGSNWTVASWTVEPLDGNLPPDGVSVVSSGSDRMDVFAAEQGGGLRHWWWNGTQFHLPSDFVTGNLTAAAVSAVLTGPGRIDVFGVSGDTNLTRWKLHWKLDGTTNWIPPDSLGGNLPGGFDVSAVSPSPGRIDVFAVGIDSTLQHWHEIALPTLDVVTPKKADQVASGTNLDVVGDAVSFGGSEQVLIAGVKVQVDPPSESDEDQPPSIDATLVQKQGTYQFHFTASAPVSVGPHSVTVTAIDTHDLETFVTVPFEVTEAVQPQCRRTSFPAERSHRGRQCVCRSSSRPRRTDRARRPGSPHGPASRPGASDRGSCPGRHG